jgi:ABC-2 type transport system ATP-binding protein
MNALVEVADLTKRFNKFVAVDHLSFNVEGGEVLAFLGPNGSGKTTTMRMIAGYLSSTEGSAKVCGFDVGARPTEVKRRIGYLAEGAPLYEDMSPAELLSFICNVRRLKGTDARHAIDKCVDIFKVGTVLHQSIGTLSKGFKRRVGLATAFIHEPQVLILDEPTDGLDPNQKYEVRQLIRHMAQDEKRAIIISTHILEEVDAVCTRAIIIDRGRIVAEGTPNELAARSDQHNAVHIWMTDDVADNFETVLSQNSFIRRVERGEKVDGKTRLTAWPTHGGNVAGQISEFAKSSNVHFDRIYTERGHLDDVFRKVTTGL